jgi:hypothetical protein
MIVEKLTKRRSVIATSIESTFDRRVKSFSDLSEWYETVFLGRTTAPS